MLAVVRQRCQSRLVAQSAVWAAVFVRPVVETRFKADGGEWAVWLTLQPSARRGGGQGLFAGRAFDAADTVTRYCGVARPRGRSEEHALRLGDGTLVEASVSEHYLFAHYIAHSASEANCVLADDGRVTAKRALAKGEELLLDYGDESVPGRIVRLYSEVALLEETFGLGVAAWATI